MILLDATTKSLQVDLAGVVTTTELPFVVSFAELNDSTFAVTDLGEADGVTSGVTAVTMVAAPATSRVRKVVAFSIYNEDSASATVTVNVLNSATVRLVCKVALATGSTLYYTDAGEIKVINSSGEIVVTTPATDHGTLTGLSDDDHTQYLLAAGSRALTGAWDAGSFKITAEQLESDIVTGTAPLVVASTTVVANLNADLLDGISIAGIAQITGTPQDNQIAVWTGAGTIEGNNNLLWSGTEFTLNGVLFVLEQAAANTDSPAYGQIWVKNTTPNEFWFTDDLGNDRELAYAGGAFHDGLSDFVANEHIDHTAVVLTAGVGLKGGGDLSASRSFDADFVELGTETTIAAADFLVMVDDTDSGSQKITFANLEAALNHDALLGFVADEHVAHGGVTLTAGAGLAGGGTIAANRTFDSEVEVNPETLTTYTVVAGDQAKLVTHSNASAIAVTLPQATGSFGAGWYYFVQNRGAGTVTITPTTSTIDGAATLALTTDQGVLVVSDGTNYFTMRGIGTTDHGALGGLTDDDHSIYVLLAGRSGGQTIHGGTGSGDDLHFQSTANATKGTHLFEEADALELVSGTTAMELRLREPSGGGTSYTGFIAPALAANVIYTLPIADGAANEVLTTNGSKVLSWAAGGGGGSVIKSNVEGRLSLTSGLSVTVADVTAATTIYWTLYKGEDTSIYTGTAWSSEKLAELSLAITATTNTIHDMFLDYNAGTVVLKATAWTNDSTRATALTTQDGVLVQTGNVDWRYVGGYRTLGVSGQTESSFLNRYAWNYYNRVPLVLRRLEATDSWTMASATLRQANSSTANQVSFIVGVAEIPLSVDILATARANTSGAVMRVQIGLDSTTTPATGQLSTKARATATVNAENTLAAHLDTYPTIGKHDATWLEGGESTTTFEGDGGSTQGQGGISGTIEG